MISYPHFGSKPSTYSFKRHSELQINVTVQADGPTIISCEGDLDRETWWDVFNQALWDHFPHIPENGTIIIVMEKVIYIDGFGLKPLIELLGEVERRAIKMRLVITDGYPLEMMTQTKAIGLFDVYSTLETAITGR